MFTRPLVGFGCNYCLIQLTTKKIITLSTLKAFQKRLEDHHQFMRIHRSYIANLNQVNKAKSSYVMIQKQKISIGDTYKAVYHPFYKKTKRILPSPITTIASIIEA